MRNAIMDQQIHCEPMRELISARMDDTITPEEDAAVERHLEECEECRAVLADYALTRDLLRIPAPDPPASLARRVRIRLATYPSDPQSHRNPSEQLSRPEEVEHEVH